VGHPFLGMGISRGASVGLFSGLVCTLLLVFANHSKVRIRYASRILTGVFFVSLVSVVFCIAIPHTRLHEWYKKETGGYRLIYGHQAIEGFKAKPILGWGPGNFDIINQTYYDSSVLDRDYTGNEIYSDKAHNVVLDVLASTGILGFLAYASIYLFALLLLWRSTHIAFYNKAIFSGLLLGYLIQNLVFFEVLVTQMMFVLLLATIVILDNGDKKELHTPQQEGYRSVVWLCLGGGFTIMLAVVMYVVVLPIHEVYFNYRFYELPPYVRGYYALDRDVSAFGTSKDTELYGNFAFLTYRTIAIDVTKSPHPEAYIRDIDQFIRTIIQNSPSGVTFWGANRIFQLLDIKYQLTGESSLFPEMGALAAREVMLSPNNVKGYIDSARVLFLEGKYPQTIDVLERALSISPQNVRIHNIIIEVAKTIGDAKLVKEKVDKANQEIPGFGFK
jgi:hypothetical protein